ncbi:MAG: hypothetical protein LUC39_01705 [Clostridiales bacterium]|nr:hypothetical protein [Clostridiales bacterium]
MLDEIKAALLTVDDHVCYGTDRELDGTDVWDYIVFRRTRTAVQTAHKGNCSDYYEVNIVRRNFVPEDEPLSVLAALAAVPGLKPAGGDISYNAVVRPGTKAQLEIATLTMVAPRKGAV